VEPAAPPDGQTPPPEAAPENAAPPPVTAPERPVKKPAAKAAPKKPFEAAPAPEKSDREKALNAAAAGATDPGASPPSDGNVAGAPAPPADAAPMVPPLADSSDTTAARADAGAKPVDSGRGAGTWVVLAALVLGFLFVVGLTVRRRRAEELSIFDRPATTHRATQPPIVHQS
jgi:hypothetical protein